MGEQYSEMMACALQLLTLDSAPLAIAVGAIPLLAFAHTAVTGSLRKHSGCPYPHAYATVEQTKSNVRHSPTPEDSDPDA